MHYRILAFDFDGTLAEHGNVPPALQNALERLRSTGHALFLVTGRHLDDLDLGGLAELFTGIVWENGAVLYHTATREVFLPFGMVDPRLVAQLTLAGVPLAHGRAIVASWSPHEQTIWQVLSAWGGDAVIVHNKGAVMILPPGAAKGPGLERMLAICGLSARNLAAFGDGENDLSLLGLADLGVAVADAVPALREAADLIAAAPGPAGVLETLEAYWLDGQPVPIPERRTRQILLGNAPDGTVVGLAGATLAGENLGVFGDSGSGKSWVTGLLGEGLHHAGYQVLLLDPEGDFRGLRSLPGFVALDAEQQPLPPPEFVAALIETAPVSVVLDLCAHPIELRAEYVSDLLRALRPIRQRTFRPHWIAIEEAQFFLAHDGLLEATMLPLLAEGGIALISYRPDQLLPAILGKLNRFLLTRLSEPECLTALHNLIGPALTEASTLEAPGYVLIEQGQSVHLRPGLRRIPHVRHLTKYRDTPLPHGKRFHFRTAKDYLGVEAANLLEFLDCLRSVPIESVTYHHTRNDFSTWAAGALGDGTLALHLRKLSHRSLHDEALRTALIRRVTDRYHELHEQER